jgi:hypothetical protein
LSKNSRKFSLSGRIVYRHHDKPQNVFFWPAETTSFGPWHRDMHFHTIPIGLMYADWCHWRNLHVQLVEYRWYHTPTLSVIKYMYLVVFSIVYLLTNLPERGSLLSFRVRCFCRGASQSHLGPLGEIEKCSSKHPMRTR